jgi:hypothetical protein
MNSIETGSILTHTFGYDLALDNEYLKRKSPLEYVKLNLEMTFGEQPLCDNTIDKNSNSFEEIYTEKSDSFVEIGSDMDKSLDSICEKPQDDIPDVKSVDIHNLTFDELSIDIAELSFSELYE